MFNEAQQTSIEIYLCQQPITFRRCGEFGSNTLMLEEGKVTNVLEKEV